LKSRQNSRNGATLEDARNADRSHSPLERTDGRNSAENGGISRPGIKQNQVFFHPKIKPGLSRNQTRFTGTAILDCYAVWMTLSVFNILPAFLRIDCIFQSGALSAPGKTPCPTGTDADQAYVTNHECRQQEMLMQFMPVLHILGARREFVDTAGGGEIKHGRAD
jgi:hypothetical protein